VKIDLIYSSSHTRKVQSFLVLENREQRINWCVLHYRRKGYIQWEN